MPKIYTKRGDQGKTDLFFSRNIDKHAAVFEALGSIDELNSFIGLLVSEYPQEHHFLKELPHILFDVGGMIAMENISEVERIYIEEVIASCERCIDEMTEQLPPLKVFIVPGGSRSVSLAHVCRTITRRVERNLWVLDSRYNDIAKLCNRLSDYFFTLSRYINYQEGNEEKRWLKREER
ncbi:MAG TPA: cob(I)yrinic acid a,c-diamide adenosyltransferase [Saprospiraceae bacterium]|nr:cob(I)yrinic acid a,c-diamide adenosyltransferase [Saprospiraceae bacterium]